MDRKLLDILCCPATKQPLALLNKAELRALNDAIAAGGLKRADGSAQSEAIKEGLITRDHQTIYRVEDGIPVLLTDEGIATALIADFPR
ncbi:MAG: Trm112 family protein [Arenimonas sp.]|jgi:uncharacterized protein YbaR (Trm112 family)